MVRKIKACVRAVYLSLKFVANGTDETEQASLEAINEARVMMGKEPIRG